MRTPEPNVERLEKLIETLALEMRAGFAEVRSQISDVRSSVSESRLLGVERHAAVLSRFDTLFGAIADLRREYSEHTHPDSPI